LISQYGASAILSPDGTTMVVAAQAGGQPRLFVRKLAELQASPLAGTDGAASPFFSLKGDWIGYFADGKLKKVSVTGGASIPLCDAAIPRGGAWIDDETIRVQSIERSQHDAPARVRVRRSHHQRSPH
jgi:serine/threonine-protein kinase